MISNNLKPHNEQLTPRSDSSSLSHVKNSANISPSFYKDNNHTLSYKSSLELNVSKT